MVWHTAKQGKSDARQVRLGKPRSLQHSQEQDRPFFEVLRGARQFPFIPAGVLAADRGHAESVWYPLVGRSGQVDLVVKITAGKRLARCSLWVRMVWARTIGHLLSELGPALAHQAREYELHRKRQSFNSLRAWLESKKRAIDFSDPEFKDVLNETRAQVVAVLVPGAYPDAETLAWSVGLFHSDMDRDDVRLVEPTDLMKRQGRDWLTRIANHPSGRGLVITGEQALRIFPTIAKPGVIITLYLKPVNVKEEGGTPGVRLVLFIYYREHEYILDSRVHNHLDVLSQRLTHLDFLRFRWGREHERELTVLTDIGRAMSHSLSDPQGALRGILQSMQRFFEVSAISINQKVQVYTEGRQETQVRMLKGIGYANPYPSFVYPVGEGLAEGKTGLVARTGYTLVSWKDPLDGEAREDYRWNEVTGRLFPFYADARGRDRCGRYLAEGDVLCFLGAPIVWRDRENSESEIIGMLKMANRTRISPQRFSNRKIAAARRIADLLAPVLYLLRERSRFGLESRMLTMRTLLRGLNHELTHPLLTIRNNAYLLSKVPSEGMQRKWLNKIVSAEFTMSKRLKSMNDLALMDAGRPEHLILFELADACCRDFRQRVQGTTTLEWEGIDRDLLVYMDPERLGMALENLLKNALDAVSRSERPRIRLFTEPSAVDGLVCLVVADNGPGVAEAIAGHEFEPFASWHKGEASVLPGQPDRLRGVGLALVRMALEAAGGRAEYKRLDDETRFQLLLPSVEETG